MSRALHRILLVLGLCILLQGCSEGTSPVLRVGINPWPGYEFIYLAQEKGYYRDVGLEVRIIEFNSLSDVRRAYERGQIDAMGTTVIEVLQARDQSLRSPQIVQVVDYSNGADVILAQPGFKDIKKLRGARVGVELASLGIYVLARGLNKHGMRLDDVKLVALDQLSMEAAFRKGEIDALVTYPPASIKLMRDANTTTVFSSAEISGEVVDVIAVDAEVIAKRQADVSKFLNAFNQAVTLTQHNSTDAYRIMAAREGITPEEFRVALTDGIKLISNTEQAEYFKPGGRLESVIDATDHILRATGQIKGPDRRAGIIKAIPNRGGN